MIKKNIFIVLIIIMFSLICGILSNDYFLGPLVLASGLLNAYYASNFKVYNYIFGAIFCLLNAYISYVNGLYGITIFSLAIFLPFQIHGYMSWDKNKNSKNEVIVRGFTLKNSIIITVSCILGSLLLGFLLTKIPGQRLAFLDSSSNTINLCGVILLNLRFKECWVIWLFNNIFDLSIWIINLLNGSPHSIMMLLISIGYLLINIYGLIKWLQTEKSMKVKLRKNN